MRISSPYLHIFILKERYYPNEEGRCDFYGPPAGLSDARATRYEPVAPFFCWSFAAMNLLAFSADDD